MGFPMMPVYMAKMGGFFFITFGVAERLGQEGVFLGCEWGHSADFAEIDVETFHRSQDDVCHTKPALRSNAP